jgi:ribonuclease D
MMKKRIYNKFDKKLIPSLPKAVFEGRIHVVLSRSQAERAVDYLLTQPILGLDTETRPAFSRGTFYKVALLQVATRDVCFLFRLNVIGMTPAIVRLLEDTSVPKIGLSWHDDLNGLHKIGRFTPGLFIDIQDHVRELGIEDLSLQKLFANLFGKQISKSQQLTNWENSHLTPEQARYASTDAWATLLIYEDLLAHEQLAPDEVIALKREEKERQIEHQQEIQDQRLREQGIEPPPHLTLEEREERQAAKRREARKRKRHRQAANKKKTASCINARSKQQKPNL